MRSHLRVVDSFLRMTAYPESSSLSTRHESRDRCPSLQGGVPMLNPKTNAVRSSHTTVLQEFIHRPSLSLSKEVIQIRSSQGHWTPRTLFKRVTATPLRTAKPPLLSNYQTPNARDRSTTPFSCT
jgi:hypothetical protein